MKEKTCKSTLLLTSSLLLFLLCAMPVFSAPREMIMAGGPAGGTFQLVAESIHAYRKIKDNKEFTIKAQPSAGSVDNLQAVNGGKADFGVVHAGHLYLGRNGLLQNDPTKYQKVLAIASLYGSPAQLVVRKGAGIKNVKDLAGKKVGVGNAGSGAYANCELFFKHLGIWNKIDRTLLGYNDAATAFVNGQLDAFWLFTAYPSSAVIIASQAKNNIDIIDLDAEAKVSGFYKKYPYFARLSIPSRTYAGVNHATPTFQDSSLLVANAEIPEDIVYKLLATIYSERGLAYMAKQKETFREMQVATGTRGIVTPMHPGAVRFWKKIGLL